MTTDRNEQILAAYASGAAVEVIAGHFGVTPEGVRRIVAAETTTPAAAGSPDRSLAVVGWVLLVLGLGPFLAGAAWLIVFFLTDQVYPVEAWGYANVIVGLISAFAGAFLGAVGLVFVLGARGWQAVVAPPPLEDVRLRLRRS